jgi:cytochrome c peroxidase
MKKTVSLLLMFFSFIVFISSSSKPEEPAVYISFYKEKVAALKKEQKELLTIIQKTDSLSDNNIRIILNKISESRFALKETDFWLRYFEPVAYKKINGPLPVEWETEVFEKYEAPYKREGAGLTLAELYFDEKEINKDTLASLISISLQATDVFLADSITRNLNTYHHFFLANRMFLLNLAAIYTTGFECPDTSRIIPELLHVLESTGSLYKAFNQGFQSYKLNDGYTGLFEKTISFVKNQPKDYTHFDHFNFIKNFINPLYQLNQKMILDYNVRTSNFNDYSLNKYATSIFDKSLYRGQNIKGVFIGIDDEAQLNELKAVGKLLFYDPILSLNNKRSCASCHKPTQYFTDTTVATNLQFDQKKFLSRNTPTLINAALNHLIMLDGKHTTLEGQASDVITNPLEMGSSREEVVKKVLSCDEYKTVFKKFLKTTPQYESVNLEHISSALMLYYSDLSLYSSSFDHAIAEKKPISAEVVNGFNLFMSKAQCATCHFVPQFNGTKPPYISSEFEVIGVPADTSFKMLSNDKGRYGINPAKETHFAFRTGSVRNAGFTKPYMHNGIFKTLEEVIDFYDAGGGTGKGLLVSNQTLSSDSLKLTRNEKKDIIAFINSLNEEIPLQIPPLKLPVSKNKTLNNRIIGGEY